MKVKITILEQNTNRVVSEIQEHFQFPSMSDQISLLCGIYGTTIKVERLMEPDQADQYDSTDDS